MRRGLCIVVLAQLAVAPAADAQTVRIDGDVASPGRVSLKGKPLTRVGNADRKFRGADVRELVLAAQPTFPEQPRNGFLRTTLTVRGAGGKAVILALGELEPEYGNRPAVLAMGAGKRGPVLAVEGDRSPTRRVERVKRITVDVEAPEPIGPPTPGAITVTVGSRERVLDRARLERLPSRVYGGTTFDDGEPESRRGVGPGLSRTLRAAGLIPSRVGSVTAVADDGYSATVTLAEAFSSRGRLGLVLEESGQLLTQPRLFVVGDIRASRWVTDVANLVVRCTPGRSCLPRGG